MVRDFTGHTATDLAIWPVMQVPTWDVPVRPADSSSLLLRRVVAKVPKVGHYERRVRLPFVYVTRFSEGVCLPTILNRFHNRIINRVWIRT